MKKNILKLLTLLAMFATSAVFGAGGDIYEILPCNEIGETLTRTDPEELIPGQKMYFKIRLLNTMAMQDAHDYWRWRYVGTGTTYEQIAEELATPLQVGIYVSGTFDVATYKREIQYSSFKGVSDFVFEYQVKPGSVALPIRLALRDTNGNMKPAGYNEEAGWDYVFLNTDKFNITREDSNIRAIMRYSSGEMTQTPDSSMGVREEDYSLIKAAFYVKSINFDPAWDAPGTAWRQVHSGSTQTYSLIPRLVAESAPVNNAVKLYVWTLDDDTDFTVRVKGGTLKEMILDYNSGVPTKRMVRVGTITFSDGQVSKDFQLEGGAESKVGSSTTLYLSDFDEFIFNKGDGTKLETSYMTVPVECIEALPPTLSIISDKKTVEANSDYMIPVAQLSIALSQAYTDPVEVTITPTFEDGHTGDIGDYVRFSTSGEISAMPAYTGAPKVTIPAGSTGAVTLYMYALRSDLHTRNTDHQIILTPSVTDTAAQAFIREFRQAGLWINAAKPQITTPNASTLVTATAGDAYELTVAIEDIYADITDQTTGYEIWFQSDSNSSLKKLDGGNYKMVDGELRSIADGSKPSVKWNTMGDWIAQIKVKSPISGKESELVSFNAKIAPARTVEIELTDDKGGNYKEGDYVNVKITLSQVNDTGAPLYAFLMPANNAKAEMFQSAGATSFIINPDPAATGNKGAASGLRINANQQSVSGRFMLLDGYSEDEGGLDLEFSVVLCSTPAYSDDTKKEGYDSNFVLVNSVNVEPVIRDVDLNGYSMNEYADHVFTMSLPYRQNQTITPDIKDVKRDIANDEDKNLQYKVTYKCNGTPMGNVTKTANPDGTLPSFDYNFPAPGVWTIKIQTKDKDMDAFPTAGYEFTVTVLKQPTIPISVPDVGYYENDEEANVGFSLDWYDIVAQYIAVKVTVVPPEGSPNAGVLKLDPLAKRGRAPYYPDLTAENEYYVFFDGAGSQEIAITELDGTPDSANKKFKIIAEVIGSDLGPDGASAQAKAEDGNPAKFKDYYLPTTIQTRIHNVQPKCDLTEPSTNAYEVAGGLASNYPINITIISDVDADLAGTAEFPGVKVTILGCTAGVVDPAQPNPLMFYVTEPGTYRFTPDFGSEQGDKTVTVMIEDKDRSFQTWSYKYTVKASKFLYTVANGPGGKGEDISSRYSEAKGIGQGRTFVQGFARDNMIAGFQIRWNCSEAVSANVYAWGYKVGDVDDGTLGPMGGVPMSPNGSLGTAGNYFTYADPERDSYLYGWIQHYIDEKKMTSELLSVAPEAAGSSARSITIKLADSKKKEDANSPYADTFAEAIFAKEWRPLDNAGDINQDGIPDRTVKKYGMGIFDVEKGTRIGNDLMDISDFNEDEDYLPAWTSTGNGIIPNTVGSWSTQGKAFLAFLEIRGIGEGLNAGYKNPDGTDPAPDYTPNEQRAYLMWKGIEEGEALADMSDEDVATLFELNIDVATQDLAIANSGIQGANDGDPAHGWSPERPTDPTLADTDKDGLDDGYEYWFWYAAKVGFTDKDGKWMPPVEVGHRLNLDDLENFEVIDSSDICRAFDPQVNNLAGGNAALSGTILDRDFDGDGLYDIEEYLIGTNPVECDTDGDGVPDGYEVMWGLNPLNQDDKTDNENNGGGGNNPDGDAMAYATDTFTVREFTMIDDDGNDMHYLVLVDYTAQQIKDTFAGSIIASKPNDGTIFGIDTTEMRFKLEEECDPSYEACVVYTIGNEVIPRMIKGNCRFNENDIPLYDEYELPLDLIHDQVFEHFGFDPRTGWSTGCTHGYVTGRWCPVCNADSALVGLVGNAGAVVNTRAYTTKDEYLLGKYLKLMGRWVNPKKDTVLNALLSNCTNPNVPFSDQRYGDAESVEGQTSTLASENHGADTDADGVADGWTLYCRGNPCLSNAWGDEAKGSGWGSNGGDPMKGDDDTLTNAAEFHGTDVVKVYASCPSIASNNVESAWLNKFFPTNPYNSDTDGDGVGDDQEGAGWTGEFYAGRQVFTGSFFSFVYTSKTIGSILAGDDDEAMSLCYRGGGMNPCSVDTDLDGLPDAWEKQFAGIIATPEGKVEPDEEGHNNDSLYTDALKRADGVGLRSDDNARVPYEGSDTDFRATSSTNHFAPVGRYIFGGMDATDSGDAFTDPSVRDEYVGTVRDRDFDGDGVENYQEYLTQSVRAWRYDDTITPLMGRGIIWKEGLGNDPELTSYVADSMPKMDILSGKEYYATLKNDPRYAALWTEMSNGNDYLEKIGNTTEEFDYKKMGYMAPCDHSWDPAYQYGLVNVYQYGGMKGMRYMMPPMTLSKDEDEGLFFFAPAAGYVSTDPRKWDTDDDGMDDYWEMFHGLNPLLGTRDIVAEMYGNLVRDKFNPWVMDDYQEYDPIRTPWRMGLPDADPDGDGLRNYDESILGNMTSPSNYHTDPSPLWMTDTSSPLSYVRQFFDVWQGDNDILFDLARYPWGRIYDAHIGTIEGASAQYLFSFEETEGYDTDGDWRGDGFEVVQSVIPASDPLNANDPDRRAALYLDGNKSCAYNKLDSKVPEVMGYGAYDFFRQFTIECWVKPERIDAEQTILERGYEYPKSNLQNNESQWRANFRLGIDASGKVYGLFDNDNAVATDSTPFSTQRVEADTLEANKWYHIALRFDGKALSLYVNGICKKTASTQLIPANGIYAISQDPQATVWDWEDQSIGTRRSLYPMARYKALEGGNTIGARRVGVDFDPEAVVGMDQFTDFFKGHIAEVRYWDGPRTEKEIHDNYMSRFSTDDMAANRDTVFDAWYYDVATRNDNDGKPNLPAQLVALYNFQTLPAAVNPGDVAKTPAGFEQGVRDNVPAEITNDELKIQWWNDWTIKSTVYDDTRVVPWIQNMVSTLPLSDGSFLDSQFWSEQLAGYYTHSRATHQMESYAIPNGGNPYKARNYLAEADIHSWRLKRMSEIIPEVATEVTNMVRRYEFEVSHQLVGNDSLLPLGGAYSQVVANYWDGQGASTAWTDTSIDSDGDGLPDWWEALYGGDLKPNDKIPYGGVKMTAAEAYMRDIAKGMQPDGSINDEYKNIADMDGDGLVDWWQQIYNVTGGAMGDDDGDGLSNYIEYLLTEVFNVGTFDPDNAYSINPKLSDYFFKVGESYVGEIFTDHDFIDDAWEDKWTNEFATRYLYDATADADNDGWSNYAEFQAGTDPTSVASLGIDSVTMPQYPTPIIELKTVYEGPQPIANIPMVVKAWRDLTLQSKPDARWTIGGGEQVSLTTGSSTETETRTGMKYLGMNSNKRVRIHLSPGSVQAGSVKIEFNDPNRYRWNQTTGEIVIQGAGAWYPFVTDKENIGEPNTGKIFERVTDKVVGEINYSTGIVDIDFAMLENLQRVEVDATQGGGAVAIANAVDVYALATSYVRVQWNSQPIMGSAISTYYLSDADAPNEANNSLGHVKEGKNTFVAFYDLDGDGQYTPGEPYGVATDVMVGWSGAKATINLTDTSVIAARFQVSGTNAGGQSSGSGNEVPNDRNVIMGDNSGNADISKLPTVSPQGKFARIRVVRTHVNGVKLLGLNVGAAKIPARVVLDKVVDLESEPFITEADFLSNNEIDLDWEYLAQDLAAAKSNIMNGNMTNVTYRVLVGNDQNLYSETNNFLAISFNRWFDNPATYRIAKPVCVGSGMEVTSPSPTFSWTIPYNLNSYTAFQIKIKDSTGTEVWNSGYRAMPFATRDVNLPANADMRYDWKAPIFADAKLPDGSKVFKNNETYTWQIKVSNSMYKNIDEVWSDEATFRMNVLENVADLGVMNVAVRYYGQSTVVDEAKPIRVQAFTRPDFSGTPVAEGYVTNVTAAALADTNDLATANAKLIGLQKGTYYIRAFIDTECDGKLANWESWGYACQRDKKGCLIYTPQEITVGESIAKSEVIKVFIEDRDTDQDNLPDAWEWTVNGGDLRTAGASALDKELKGAVAVKSSLTEGLNEATADAMLTSGLSVRLRSALRNPFFAAAVLGVDVSGANSSEEANNIVQNSVVANQSVEAKSVNVTGIAIDAEGKVVLDVETIADVDLGAPKSATALYTFNAVNTVTVELQLYMTTDITNPDWQLIATEDVVIGCDEQKTQFKSSVTAEQSKGFFKVILKEKK